MIIKKFLHSCVLLEENGKRLLIDPGIFSFIEKKVTPEDIGPVDGILLTHEHPDHYAPEIIKQFMVLNPTTTLATHEGIGKLLQVEGLPYRNMSAGGTMDVAGFIVQALEAPHGAIPFPAPQNLAYHMNTRFLHPGDSLTTADGIHCDVLALPIAGPWLKLVDTLAWAKQVKPRIAIPIHDVFIKDFFLDRMYQMCAKILTDAGIEFRPLNIGESLEV